MRLDYKPVTMTRTSRWSASTDGASPKGSALPSGIPSPPSHLPSFVAFIPSTTAEPRWEDLHRRAVPHRPRAARLSTRSRGLDGTLSFRRRCAHGICGRTRCASTVATALPARRSSRTSTLDKPITVEAIKGLPLEKDLIVDMEPFFEAYRAGHALPHPRRPRAERNACSRPRIAPASTTPPSASCVLLHDLVPGLLDRRSVLRARRDRRRRTASSSTVADSGLEQRLDILNDKEGVWRCRTTFNCTDACPRGIEVTKAIQEVKRALIFRRV